MNANHSGLIDTMMSLPIFQAEWVLYLLIGISLLSVAVMIERGVFLRRHRVNVDVVKNDLMRHLNLGDFEGAAAMLERHDSMETNTVLYGLKNHAMGPDSVEDLLAGAARKEQARYERRLPLLATVASNAPFIGLFGTVLGIIRAFKELSGNMSEASSSVMAGIAEALIATAVGLLVAIPAVIAFNAFKGVVNHRVEDMNLLSSILTANLKAAPGSASGESGKAA
jgi:biopolymer transport protein ExbB